MHIFTRISSEIALLSIFCSLLLTPAISLNSAVNRDAAPPHNNVDYTLKQVNENFPKFNVSKSLYKIVIEQKDLNWFLVLLRRLSMNAYNTELIFRLNREAGKSQRLVPKTEPFPCDLRDARSSMPPTSVHRLRPGDIDVVAVIGDSSACGNGAISSHYLHGLNEFRGIAFPGGGMRDWRTYLTLPNILKVFNTRLYGYATANVLAIDASAHLNIAEPLIMSSDFPFQAHRLVERMRHDLHVNLSHHWKLLTVYLGNNDICSYSCHYENITGFLQLHENDLRAGFTILRDNVPRLLINLVTLPNLVEAFYPMRNMPLACEILTHYAGCHCLFSSNSNAERLQLFAKLIKRWNGVDRYVASLPEFQTDDFAVLYQPFLTEAKLPLLPNGDTDLRYFGSDCFHFSQLGHAAVANSLWNNMLQPEGHKQLEISASFKHFECPSAERPFFATRQNGF